MTAKKQCRNALLTDWIAEVQTSAGFVKFLLGVDPSPFPFPLPSSWPFPSHRTLPFPLTSSPLPYPPFLPTFPSLLLKGVPGVSPPWKIFEFTDARRRVLGQVVYSGSSWILPSDTVGSSPSPSRSHQQLSHVTQVISDAGLQCRPITAHR